jgi:hypothetical protein
LQNIYIFFYHWCHWCQSSTNFDAERLSDICCAVILVQKQRAKAWRINKEFFSTSFIKKNNNLKFYLFLKKAINILGPVTNAENINAKLPKILTPTHFWCTKNIKADSFLALKNINADMLKLNNNTENMTDINAKLKLSGY